MLGLSLENSGSVLGLTGLTLLSASSLSVLMRSSCILPQSMICEKNDSEVQNGCPINLLTRSGLILGVASVGTGSALRLVSLLR